MTTPVPTQADRDAAAELAEWLTAAQREWENMIPWFMPSFPAEVRKGTWDNHDFVQAFTRHRLTAERETREACARYIEDGCFDASIRLDRFKHKNLSDWFRKQQAAGLRNAAIRNTENTDDR